MITITNIAKDTFDVTVNSNQTTNHRVILDDEYQNSLRLSHVEKQTIIKASFEFLLEREPNTSILSSFNLSQIKTYFGDFETIIKDQID